jgi:hypothetical protein
VKFRNPANAADPEGARVLAMFARDSTLRAVTLHTTINGTRGTRYLRRITVEPSCLLCHGAKASRPAFVTTEYPNDRAYGFRAGDLRGAYSVFIPARADRPAHTALLRPHRACTFRNKPVDVVLDVRSKLEFFFGHLPSACCIPLPALEAECARRRVVAGLVASRVLCVWSLAPRWRRNSCAGWAFVTSWTAARLPRPGRHSPLRNFIGSHCGCLLGVLVTLAGCASTSTPRTTDLTTPRPTRVVTHVVTHDAKLIGSAVGGVRVTIRDVATDRVLAEGATTAAPVTRSASCRMHASAATRCFPAADGARYDATIAIATPTCGHLGRGTTRLPRPVGAPPASACSCFPDGMLVVTASCSNCTAS